MGLPQWQGWAAVHSVNGFKDYSGGLSTVYVSCCDNKNVGGPNIVDLAIHMANYQHASGFYCGTVNYTQFIWVFADTQGQQHHSE